MQISWLKFFKHFLQIHTSVCFILFVYHPRYLLTSSIGRKVMVSFPIDQPAFHLPPSSSFRSNHNMYERWEDRNPSGCEWASPSTQFSHQNCKQSPFLPWTVYIYYSTLTKYNSTHKLDQSEACIFLIWR